MRASPIALLLVCATLSATQSVSAQRSEPSTLRALRITDSVRIDGLLDEAAWRQAQHISNFTQRELDYGSPVSERTEVAILFDGDALYIGFWGYDSEPDRILASEMAYDFSWQGDDNFEVILDTFNDDRSGYLFVTNPNGAQADALVADNGGRVNRDWDGIWEVETTLTDQGWFAEMRIPFSTLRHGPRPGEGWGINFERNIRRKREQVMWQGWSRDFNLEYVSLAGTLMGLGQISDVALLEIRPLGVAGVEWSEDAPRQSVGDLGLDIDYLPTPNWKLNLTFNPDFAQVESDREEVNLTRFPLFFPEKRSFFLEGQEFFDFELGEDVRPFYSRRIGLAADRTEIPILGGVRLLGRQEEATLGAMVLQTEGKGGEPATNFGVLRYNQDVLDESSIGVLAVSKLSSGRTHATYGVDLLYATSEFFGEREFEVGLAAAQSYTSDLADRRGFAHRLSVEYPNDLVEFSASWSRSDSTFNPEVGFVRRTGFERLASELAIAPRPRFLPFIQQMEIKPFEVSYYEDEESGSMQSLYLEFVPLAFTTRGGDDFEFAFTRRADRLDEPFELFEGEEIPIGTYWFTRWLVELSSFSGRSLSGDLEVAGGDFYLGRRTEYSSSASWRASRHFTLGADYEHNTISLEGESFEVDEFAGRLDFAASPTLFGAVAGQWNSEDEEVILNFRLNWIPRPGSDLFLVINHLAATEDAGWVPLQTTLISKLVWRIAF
ncbi:DUF5916 domain-containing protein [Gemmatimonadota bacterium]